MILVLRYHARCFREYWLGCPGSAFRPGCSLWQASPYASACCHPEYAAGSHSISLPMHASVQRGKAHPWKQCRCFAALNGCACTWHSSLLCPKPQMLVWPQELCMESSCHSPPGPCSTWRPRPSSSPTASVCSASTTAPRSWRSGASAPLDPPLHSTTLPWPPSEAVV